MVKGAGIGSKKYFDAIESEVVCALAVAVNNKAVMKPKKMFFIRCYFK